MLSHNPDLPLALLWPLSLGIAINFLHFWMKIRLQKHGFPVKWLIGFGDDSRMWKQYREAAKSKGWSVWPYYMYWSLWIILLVSLALMIPTLRRMGESLKSRN